MKVVNRSAWVQDDGTVSWWNRIKGTLQFGMNWYGEIEAMQTVVNRLQRVLSGQFVLLRGLTLPGLNLEIPGILIGPSGVYVLYASPLRGIFRIKSNRFVRMDTTTRQFRDVQPNLVRRTQLMGRAVELFFQRKGVEIPVLEPVLVFTNPGIHIDAARPAVRIVQIDVLDRIAARLVQGRRRFSSEDVQYLARLLLHPDQVKDQEVPKQEEAPEDSSLALSFEGPADTVPQERTGSQPMDEETLSTTETLLETEFQLSDSPPQEAERTDDFLSVNLPVVGQITMMRKQWLLLGGLVGMEITLVLIFLLMVFLIRI